MENELINNENDLLVVACAGAINQELHLLIELLNKEIQILKSYIGNNLKLKKDEKRLLDAMSRDLERRILRLSEHIVTIDSLRRWYRELIAITYSTKKRGRPRTTKNVEELVCKLATQNPHWGEDSIRDRIILLGFEITDRTVSNILKRNGIPPAPEREKTNDWDQFLEDHWPGLYAIDFATFEIPDDVGNRTHRCHALYAIKLETREAKLLGVRSHADGKWVTQMARNECNEFGFFHDATDIIMDRDSLYCHNFQEVLRTTGITAKILPAQSPNLNAYIERFIGTVRREVCRNYIPLSEDRLRNRLEEHVKYYNQERNHQSLGDNLMPDLKIYDTNKDNTGPIKRRSRVGKVLNYYYREAI